MEVGGGWWGCLGRGESTDTGESTGGTRPSCYINGEPAITSGFAGWIHGAATWQRREGNSGRMTVTSTMLLPSASGRPWWEVERDEGSAACGKAMASGVGS